MLDGPAAHPPAPRERVIEAGRAERDYWLSLWRYRELLAFLAWRDVLVRYKQTVIGVLWAVIRPVLTLIIFVLVFGRIANLPSPDGLPYVLLVCGGLLPWTLFANALGDASNSLLTNANLIAKVAFPRMIVPLSSLATGLIDFLVSLVILFALMVYYGIAPTWRLAFLPVFAGLTLMLAAGLGLILATLNVRYRDFRYIIPFVLQFGLYASPVGYSTANVPERWQWLFALNPLVGVIDGFRWSVFGNAEFLAGPGLVVAVPVILATFVVGVEVFRRYERDMVDEL